MRALYCAVCVHVLLPIGFAAAQQTPATSPEHKAVEETARAFVQAFDAGDAVAVAALWTPDAQYTVGQTTVKGQPEIQKLYQEFFQAHPGSKMELKIDSIQVVAPTVAIEQGIASVGDSPHGSPSSSSYMAVHVQQNGKWRMASVRESETPLPPRSEDLQELAWLVGDWQAQGEAVQVDIKYDWIANQNYLRGETTVKANDAAEATPGGMQIIGKDPFTGQIVTWFFHADGGHGYGVWTKDGDHWVVATQGATADGVPTTATNVLYHADENVMSWRSLNRVYGGHGLPNTGEVVLERVTSPK